MAATTSTDTFEDEMWASHTKRVREAQPRVQELIEEVTGWSGCGKLADHVVELILANQGGSGDEEVRPPCWRSHAPATVEQFIEQLSRGTGRPVDDPLIQQQAETYRLSLIKRFGLSAP